MQSTVNLLLVALLMLLLFCSCTSSQNVPPKKQKTFVADSDKEFKVTCMVPTSAKLVRWYKDWNVITSNKPRVTILTNGHESQLTVRDVRLSDAGYYHCETNNNQRSSSGCYINVISIDITAPSPQQLIYQSNGMIECSSVNDTTPVWHTVNPDAPIVNNATYSIEQRGLNITNVQFYHQQQYRCEHLLVTNHLGRSVIIDVEVLVPSMIMSAPKNISVLKGQAFSISFDYLAIPAPNFTWYINDILHCKVNSTSEGRNSHNMTFTNANEEGWYRCMVQNDLGTTEYTVFVDILVPPQITAVDTQVAAVGTAVTLTCTSSGDAPINFHWTYSGNTFTNDGRISGADTNTLTITGLTEADNGTYMCIATNAYGNDTAEVTVIVIGLPQPASNVNINGITSTSALVTWNIATNTLNHPVNHVFVNYHIRGSRDVTSVRIQSSTSQLMVEHLIPHTNYVVNIIPNNLAGNSTSTLDHHFKTTVGAPRIATVTTTSNSYNSIQLSVTLLYIGGRPVTEFLIRYRIVDSDGWRSLPVATNYTSISTAWSYSLTDLQYDQRGYEVEIVAANSVNQSNIVTSSPVELFTVLPGKPNIMEPSLASITENSVTVTCYVLNVGQPSLHVLRLAVISPVERFYMAKLPSYSAGANVSIVASNLSSDTEYVFTCYASSVVGDGEHSDQITVRTKSVMHSDMIDIDDDYTRAVAGGIAGTVLITMLTILLMILILWCYSKLHKDRNKHGNSSVVVIKNVASEYEIPECGKVNKETNPVYDEVLACKEVKMEDPAYQLSTCHQAKMEHPNQASTHDQVKMEDPAYQLSTRHQVKMQDPDQASTHNQVKMEDPAYQISTRNQVKMEDPAYQVSTHNQVKMEDLAYQVSTHNQVKMKDSPYQVSAFDRVKIV